VEAEEEDSGSGRTLNVEPALICERSDLMSSRFQIWHGARQSLSMDLSLSPHGIVTELYDYQPNSTESGKLVQRGFVQINSPWFMVEGEWRDSLSEGVGR